MRSRKSKKRIDLHQIGVDLIREKLNLEFKISGYKQEKKFSKLIPDYCLKKPNGKYLVAEVGTTNAEKIFSYLRNKEIEEIRWYTRKGKRIGLWSKSKEYHKSNNAKVSISEILSNFRGEFKYYQKLKRRAKLRSQIVLENYWNFIDGALYVTIYICPICGRKVRLVNTKPIQSSEKSYQKILVCNNCADSKLKGCNVVAERYPTSRGLINED